jgi:pheromone shutdown protein TraB
LERAAGAALPPEAGFIRVRVVVDPRNQAVASMMVRAAASTKVQVAGFQTVVAVVSAGNPAVVSIPVQAAAFTPGQVGVSLPKSAVALMLASKGLPI